MSWRTVLWSGLGVAILLVATGGGWLLSLPPARASTAAPPLAFGPPTI
jgi:hypothetical protein